MTLTIVVPKESAAESRVAVTPTLLSKLTKFSSAIKIQSEAGSGICASDTAYKGASIVGTSQNLYQAGDLIIKVQPPTLEEVALYKDNSTLVSLLYPHLNPELIKQLLAKKITSFAMELIPRISRAQNMDVLSSQATIVGYKAVLIAANSCKFFFPMLTTAAGSVRPAKVLIIGAGVAGLQAIATARRLGAIVEAYDVRAETKEEVASLGAKFIDTGIVAIGAGGYARELSTEERQQQQDILKKHVSISDVIITTAGVPGKQAPRIITQEMVEAMKPGSVIVDVMAENGGNCELTKPGITVMHNHVTIIGPMNISSTLATNASEMYAKNIINFLDLIVNDTQLNIDWEDEIVAGCAVTHNGEIINQKIKQLLEGKL